MSGIVDVDPYLATQWDRWLRRRSTAARDHLIVSYSPLVKFIAGRVGAGLPANVDPGDLVSSGVLGLIDAIERFDPGQGVKFETFATPRIRGAIYDGLRQLDWVPRSVRSRAREVQRAMHEFEAVNGRSPSDRELAEQLGIERAELDRWLQSIATTTVGPLERALAAGAEPKALSGEVPQTPSKVVEDREVRELMRNEIDKLPDREKIVLSLYYDEGLTLAQIARVLGVSESRVPQLHSKSVLHLRSRLEAAGVA
jgi:RNA polymerase sigma factor for flagellar operon FliA